jgi:hypothetical protein
MQSPTQPIVTFLENDRKLLKLIKPQENKEILSVFLLPSRENQGRKVLGSSSLVGFKKTIYNHVIARDGNLYPFRNRKKNSHTHFGLKQQLSKLGKSFGYLSQNLLHFCVGEALKSTYSSEALLKKNRAVPNLVEVIETHLMIMLTRNQRYVSFSQAKQSLNSRRGKCESLACSLDLSQIRKPPSEKKLRQVLKLGENNRITVPWINVGSVI